MKDLLSKEHYKSIHYLKNAMLNPYVEYPSFLQKLDLTFIIFQKSQPPINNGGVHTMNIIR